MNIEKVLFLVSSIYQKIKQLFWSKSNFDIHEILVVKWDEIGDMAAALHVFELIKGSFPKSKITLICKEYVLPIVANNPFIDSIYTQPKSAFIKKYDTIIDLRSNFSILRKCIDNNPKMYLGRGIIRFKNRKKQKHETATNYEIIAPILTKAKPPVSPKIYITGQQIQEVDAFLKSNNIQKYAVLHTLARAKLRQWSIKNYITIAHYLYQKYQLSIILACSPEETKSLSPHLINMPINTTIFNGAQGLLSFAALCKQASIFIGNESGPLQIASTFYELPKIGLFGPGVKDVFYPIGGKVIHHVLDCNPCNQINCVRPDNPCIDLITIAEVQDAIDDLLR